MHNFTPTNVGVFWVKMCEWVTFSILQDFTHANVVALTIDSQFQASFLKRKDSNSNAFPSFLLEKVGGKYDSPPKTVCDIPVKASFAKS